MERILMAPEILNFWQCSRIFQILEMIKNQNQRFLISKKPPVYSLVFWDARKFFQKNFLHRKCSAFSCARKWSLASPFPT
jgi:hypothetical protein